MRVVACLIAVLALSCARPDPSSDRWTVTVPSPSGPVVTSDVSSLLAADAGSDEYWCPDSPDAGACCYPPSWPSHQGACSCIDATGQGCVWDEQCDGGACSTPHPTGVIKAFPKCGVCQ